MTQTLGESTEAWGLDVWNKAEKIGKESKADGPFYIVYAAKKDGKYSNVFNQGFKTYYERPPKVLGCLVWYADRERGYFDLVPELSFPPDVPIDPSLLSSKSEDFSPELAQRGQQANVLLS